MTQYAMFDQTPLQLFRQYAWLAANHHKSAHRNREFCLTETDKGMARVYLAFYLYHGRAARDYSAIARMIRDEFEILMSKRTDLRICGVLGKSISHA